MSEFDDDTIDRIDELLVLAALGELSEADEAELDAALAADAGLVTEYRSDLEVAAQLQSVHREPPPAALKASVFAAIDALSDVAEPVVAESTSAVVADVPAPVTSLDAERRRRRSGWAPLAAAAAVVMLLVGGIIVATGADDGTSFDAIATAPDAERRAFAGDLGGSLDVVYSETYESFVLSGDDLPTLTAAETYQLWFVDGESVTSVGLFRPDDDGRVEAVFEDLDPRDVLVGVTVEPAGGSESPTLPVVASA